MNAIETPDWLDEVLNSEVPLPADQAFVAKVLQQLDVPQQVPYARPTEVLDESPWRDVLMAVSTITLLMTFTPAVTQGLLVFSHAPWDATVWSQGELVAACLSVAVLVHGALDLAQVRLFDVMA